MTEAQLKDTKQRILEAARALFAAKGYDGTSVRDIAKVAEVNVAALNYHFQGKQNLLNEVSQLVFNESSIAIREHRENHPTESVEELAVWIFGHFIASGDVLRAMFKMMLSEEGWGDDADCGGEEEPYGPPGGRALAMAIIQELKHEVPESDMYWAVKTIFTNVVHVALMYTNHFCRLPADQVIYHDRATLEADLRRLVKVVLRDL